MYEGRDFWGEVLRRCALRNLSIFRSASPRAISAILSRAPTSSSGLRCLPCKTRRLASTISGRSGNSAMRRSRYETEPRRLTSLKTLNLRGWDGLHDVMRCRGGNLRSLESKRQYAVRIGLCGESATRPPDRSSLHPVCQAIGNADGGTIAFRKGCFGQNEHLPASATIPVLLR